VKVALGDKLLGAVARRNVVAIDASALRPRPLRPSSVVVIATLEVTATMVVVVIAPVVVLRAVIVVVRASVRILVLKVASFGTVVI